MGSLAFGRSLCLQLGKKMALMSPRATGTATTSRAGSSPVPLAPPPVPRCLPSSLALCLLSTLSPVRILHFYYLLCLFDKVLCSQFLI